MLVAFLTLPPAHADTPVIGLQGNNCQSTIVPRLCRTDWQGATFMRFRLLNHTYGDRPQWALPLEQARQRWHYAPGPQWIIGEDSPPQSYIHLFTSQTGQNGITGSTIALTYNCIYLANGQPECISSATAARNYASSSIYFATNMMDGLSTATQARVFAHEYGHAFGLYHNDDVSRPSLMAGYIYASNIRDYPQGDDIGNTDWCTDRFGPRGGIRCIYRYNGRL